MKISVSGIHLDVGTALQEYVEAELTEVVNKYFEKAISADVVFTKVRHLFRADIMVNEGTGTNHVIKASAEDDDVYAAFSIAAARAEKQLRRYKRRIKAHRAVSAKELSGTKYVIPATSGEEDNDSGDAPLIIAEKPAVIEELTVSDAVMRMDLGQLPALMFINKKTGAVNVVYKREDGNISWIDASDCNKSSNIKAA